MMGISLFWWTGRKLPRSVSSKSVFLRTFSLPAKTIEKKPEKLLDFTE